MATSGEKVIWTTTGTLKKWYQHFCFVHPPLSKWKLSKIKKKKKLYTAIAETWNLKSFLHTENLFSSINIAISTEFSFTRFYFSSSPAKYMCEWPKINRERSCGQINPKASSSHPSSHSSWHLLPMPVSRNTYPKQRIENPSEPWHPELPFPAFDTS